MLKKSQVVNLQSCSLASVNHYLMLSMMQVTHHLRQNHSDYLAATLNQHLRGLIELCPEMASDEPPRRTDGPLVLVMFPSGAIGQIDGRRRLNRAVRNGEGMRALVCMC